MWKSKSKKSTTTTTTSAPVETKFDSKKLENLFDTLVDEDDPTIITMSGICEIAEKLSIDPSNDVRILVFVWKLNAKTKPGTITKEEFINGMTILKRDSIDGLRELLPSLDPGFLEKDKFRDFYKFVFQFSREGTHKTLEKDVVLSLLPIVLDKNRAPHLDYFIDYLSTCSHTRITLDQWDSFLQFNYVVDINISNYEDDGAWPLLLDEYVEWRKSKAA